MGKQLIIHFYWHTHLLIISLIKKNKQTNNRIKVEERWNPDWFKNPNPWFSLTSIRYKFVSIVCLCLRSSGQAVSTLRVYLRWGTPSWFCVRQVVEDGGLTACRCLTPFTLHGCVLYPPVDQLTQPAAGSAWWTPSCHSASQISSPASPMELSLSLSFFLSSLGSLRLVAFSPNSPNPPSLPIYLLIFVFKIKNSTLLPSYIIFFFFHLSKRFSCEKC